jgi:hypothetical protein
MLLMLLLRRIARQGDYGGGNITHHLRCAAPALRLPNLRDVVDGSLRVSVRHRCTTEQMST